MRGAHRPVASVSRLCHDCGGRCAGRDARPHGAIRAATSHDRGVNVCDSRQYSHARSTNPRPQQTSAILASSRFTPIIHTRVEAVRMVPVDERRRATGHELRGRRVTAAPGATGDA